MADPAKGQQDEGFMTDGFVKSSPASAGQGAQNLRRVRAIHGSSLRAGTPPRRRWGF